MKTNYLHVGDDGYIGEIVIFNGAISIGMKRKPNPFRLWFMKVFLGWEWRDCNV